MNKLLLTIIAVLCYSVVGNAEQLREQDARSIAKSFFADKTEQGMLKSVNTDLHLAYKSKNETTGNEGAYYVFNRGVRDGYVVVAGDDAVATPVLGYSENGTFEYENIPENMRYWLDVYQRQIEYLQENSIQSTSVSPREWTTSVSPREWTTSVSPLLGEIKWDQSEPYNLLCPTLPDGRKTVVGCTATAMAQIMGYWKWPDVGMGGRSYLWNNGESNKTLSAMFAYSTYEWSKMLPTYNTSSSLESKMAVAKLMSDVGISIDMKYGYTSGAYSKDVPYALMNYFKYKNGVKYIERSGFIYSDWEDMIRFELDAKRPVLYSGFRPAGGGHAFVCDGYNEEGYFHINWGWSGSHDGYFLLQILSIHNDSDYDSGYSYRQGAVIGIQPENQGGVLNGYVELNGWTIKTTECSADTAARIYIAGARNCYSDTLGFDFALNLYKETELVMSHNILSRPITPPKAGLPTSYQDIKLPKNIEDGEYKLYPQYKFIGEDTACFRNMRPKTAGACPYLNITVKDGVGTLANPPYYYVLSASEIEFLSRAVSGQEFRVRATVKNHGELEYCDKLYFKVWDSKMRKMCETSSFAYMETGDEIVVICDLPAIKDVYDKFNLVLCDAKGNVISRKEFFLDYSIGEPEIEIVDDLATVSTEMLYNDIEATVKLKNTGGYFAGEMRLYIWGNVTNYHFYKYLTLETNEEKTLTFKGELSDSEIGSECTMVLLHYVDKNKVWSNKVKFTVVADKSNVEEVNDNNVVEVEIYTLSGRLVAKERRTIDRTVNLDMSKLEKGLYIVRTVNAAGDVKVRKMQKM